MNYIQLLSCLLISNNILIPVASDCLEFWKTWRTCPSDLFSNLNILCYHEIKDSFQVLITKEIEKDAAVICHNETFPSDSFMCLPMENIRQLSLQNCPFPKNDINNYISNKSLQHLNIDFNKMQIQYNPLIIKDYTSLQLINLNRFRTLAYFDIILESLPSIVSLTILNHNFTSMPEKPFRHLSTLQLLTIKEGILEKLPDDFLFGLENLLLLDLSQNHLKTLQPMLLNNLVHLKNLNLTDNHLKYLDENVFSTTINLEILTIHYNRLIEIPTKLFQNLINLKGLLLNYNNITILSNKIFHHLSNLQILSLESNDLHFLPNDLFIDLVSLTWLDLQHNHISILSENLFQHQINMYNLDLSGNQISQLSSRLPFGPSTFLANVNLSKNQFDHFPDIHWKAYNIMHFDMSYNRIQNFSFPSGMIDNSSIYLQHNNIATITTPIYLGPEPVYIYQIFLAHNPLNCNCKLGNFIQSLSYIPIGDKNSLRCQAPWYKKGKRLIEISNQHEICQNDSTCPLHCQCNKIENEVHVNCTNQYMFFPPFNLPLNTTIINLEKNKIFNLSSINISSWQNVTHLHMSDNSLSSLDDWIIPQNLQFLSIDDNQLSSIPLSIMNYIDTKSNFQIFLADNAWSCDCNLIPFKKWFMRNLPKIKDSMYIYCDGNRERLFVETRINELTCCSDINKSKIINIIGILYFYIVYLKLLNILN